MKYRRVYINGATYFFTLVTFQRLPIFSSQPTIDLFYEAIRYTASRMPFEIVAFVILPDHIHCIWTLPEGSSDYSTRWRLVKSYFTRNYNQHDNASVSASRSEKKEQEVWQRRFWEHWIRDETDLRHHVEYIHYNPIKHGYVRSLMEWKNSSFVNYVKDGLYPANWGEDAPEWSGSRFME
jgi:putative transposase